MSAVHREWLADLADHPAYRPTRPPMQPAARQLGDRVLTTSTGVQIGSGYIKPPRRDCGAFQGPYYAPRKRWLPWVLIVALLAMLGLSWAVFASGPSESEVAQLVHQQVQAVAQEIK